MLQTFDTCSGKNWAAQGAFSQSQRHRTVGEEEDAVFISCIPVCGNRPLIKVFLMLHRYTHIFIHTDAQVCTQTHMQRNVYAYTYAHIHYRGIHRDVYRLRDTHTHTYLHTFLSSANPFSSDFFIPNFPPKSLHSFLPLPPASSLFNTTVNSNMGPQMQVSGSCLQGDQMSQFA